MTERQLETVAGEVDGLTGAIAAANCAFDDLRRIELAVRDNRAPANHIRTLIALEGAAELLQNLCRERTFLVAAMGAAIAAEYEEGGDVVAPAS
jgi:hypothetical protein